MMITLSKRLVSMMNDCGPNTWAQILDAGTITPDFAIILETLTTTKQLEQVRLAIESGLSYEQIVIFAHPEFGGKKMAQMRTGFEYGLTIEQVKVYAKPELSVLQMKHLKLALVSGFPIEQVEPYAVPSVHYIEIAQLHKKNLPYDVKIKEHFIHAYCLDKGLIE